MGSYKQKAFLIIVTILAIGVLSYITFKRFVFKGNNGNNNTYENKYTFGSNISVYQKTDDTGISYSFTKPSDVPEENIETQKFYCLDPGCTGITITKKGGVIRDDKNIYFTNNYISSTRIRFDSSVIVDAEVITNNSLDPNGLIVKNSDNLYGYIDLTKRTVALPLEYSYLAMDSALGYMYENILIFAKNNKYGLINVANNTIVMDNTHENISYMKWQCHYYSKLHCGYVLVRDNNKVKLYNYENTQLLNGHEYDNIFGLGYYEEIAMHVFVLNGTKVELVNEKGELIKIIGDMPNGYEYYGSSIGQSDINSRITFKNSEKKCKMFTFDEPNNVVTVEERDC